MGKRLGIGTTKALVEVEGIPLIIRNLQMLDDVEDIRVVVGYQADRVINMVNTYRKDVTFVFNHNFMNNGTGASVSLASDYSNDYKTDLYDMIFNGYLKNKEDNIDKIKNSSYYMSNNNYPFSTEGEPIILAPVYKNDSIYHEIENCDIYYYYFKPEDIKGMTEAEQVQFLKDLPKYKAVELYTSIVDPHKMINNQIKRETAYTLIYWGDGTPVPGVTKGDYYFPEGYKIGFMLRSIDTEENHNNPKIKDMRDGEVYCDGRLNKDINNFGHFKTSKLGANDPSSCNRQEQVHFLFRGHPHR